MILLVAATHQELRPLPEINVRKREIRTLVGGVGGVETALSLCRFLSSADSGKVEAVINFGVAGAFVESGPGLLDLCLAEREILADFGICKGEVTDPFDFLSAESWQIQMDRSLLHKAETVLRDQQISYCAGNFVTVNGVSGQTVRGNHFRDRFQAICENMEGFAVARVCQEFSIPCLEVRAVSNLVEDRNRQKWKLEEACYCAAQAAARLAEEISP